MNGVVPLLKFTPSAQDPEALEAITVQREQVIGKLVGVALDADGSARHQLLIGPRGIGKTHILSLVASRVGADPRGRQVSVAWLEEDPWAITSYEKLLAAIVAQVAAERSDATLAETASRLRARRDETGHEAEQALRDALGGTRLVLLVENLDEIFRRIGDNGQERLRAFLENWGQVVVVATAPQLFEGVQLHESPFYGFFAITHLEELSLESATELMRRVAELRHDTELVQFLATETAARRLAAIEALAGGHPRIWILLSGCVSIKAIDELVPLFMEALDDLTPYYQDRLRELSDQQQELVVLMAEDGGALSNRGLAERSGIAQNQVATILKQLTDRGYIRRAEVSSDIAGGDARMSYWELREPLMRLCLDVKQSRGKPLRMLVGFLRAWYGVGLLDELALLPASAPLAATYVAEAFRTLDEEMSVGDLLHGSPVEVLGRADLGLTLTPKRFDLRIARGTALFLQEEFAEARDEFESLLAEELPKELELMLKAQLASIMNALGEEFDSKELAEGLRELASNEPDDGHLQVVAAMGLAMIGRFNESLGFFPRATELAPGDAELFHQYGAALAEVGRYGEALEMLTKASKLEPKSPAIYHSRGRVLQNLGQAEDALAAFARAKDLDPNDAPLQERIGIALSSLGRNEEALVAFDRAAALDPDNVSIEINRGRTLAALDKVEEAVEAFSRTADLGSEDPMIHLALGAGLMSMQRYDKALAAFERVIGSGFEEPMVYLMMAAVLPLLGRREEAVAAVREGIERNPNSGRLYEYLALVLFELNRSNEALEAFEKASKLDRATGNIPNQMAIMLRNKDRLDDAASAARIAVEREKEDPIYRVTLAEIGLARGEGHQAVASLREALALRGENSQEPYPGDTAFVCRMLWHQRVRGQRAELIDDLVAVFGEAGVAKDLGRSLVDSVRWMADSEVSVQEADAWIADWRAARRADDLEIPLKLLEAAAKWKKDRDRSHLLDLPPEQREILIDLLSSDESSALGGE